MLRENGNFRKILGKKIANNWNYICLQTWFLVTYPSSRKAQNLWSYKYNEFTIDGTDQAISLHLVSCEVQRELNILKQRTEFKWKQDKIRVS